MNLKGVPTNTWVRIIVLFLLLINQISLSIFNFQLLPFDDEQIYEYVSHILTVVVVIWASWKNNSFTKEAQAADEHLKRLKN